MKRIFKYTFLQQLPRIILTCAIMACMSGVELLFLIAAKHAFNGFYVLWLALTVIALAITPFLLFIRCSSGYARTLLFTNESYLMLTLPVRTEWILLGRILCGLLEFVICTLTSWFFLILIGIGCSYHYIKIDHRILWELTPVPPPVLFLFTKNIPGFFALFHIFLSAFILIGNIALAVQTAIRSFNIKRMRALWTVGFILIVISILFFIGRIETKTVEIFGNYCPITVYIMTSADKAHIAYPAATVNIPVVSILISLGLGIGCFFISTWLLKNKVEV